MKANFQPSCGLCQRRRLSVISPLQLENRRGGVGHPQRVPRKYLSHPGGWGLQDCKFLVEEWT